MWVWLVLLISHSEALIVRNCNQTLPVEPEQAYQAAIRGGQYLANHIRDDGSFDYLYYPDRDESSQYEYSWLRHVGALYGLFELYARERDEVMLSRGKLALQAFIKKVVPCQGGRCLDAHGYTSIGSSGIALMTLSAYERATKDKTYAEMTHELAAWILTKQREDGTFEDHDLDVKTGAIQPTRNTYGLGEALLSLIQLDQMGAEKKYLHAVSKGLHALFERADDSFLSSSTHWLGPTLRLTHESMPDPRYLDYAARLIHCLEARVDSHPLCSPSSDRSCWRPNSAACMTDGATASWALLQGAHRAKSASLALGILEHWLTYVMQSHIDPKKAGKFQNPSSALGGIRGTNHYVRIDDVSHASTALLAYSEAAKLLGAC